MEYVVIVDGVRVGVVRDMRYYAATARSPMVHGFGRLEPGPGARMLRHWFPAPPPFLPFAVTGRSSALPVVPDVACALRGSDGTEVGASAVLRRSGRGTAEVDELYVYALWTDAPTGVVAMLAPQPLDGELRDEPPTAP